VSGASGTRCDRGRIELLLNLKAGARDKSEVDVCESISVARDVLKHHLFTLGYIKNASSTPQLILEGVADYPVELVDAATSQGISLWCIVLRIHKDHANISKFETGALFREYDALSALLASPEYGVQEAEARRKHCASNRCFPCDSGYFGALDRGLPRLPCTKSQTPGFQNSWHSYQAKGP